MYQQHVSVKIRIPICTYQAIFMSIASLNISNFVFEMYNCNISFLYFWGHTPGQLIGKEKPVLADRILIATQA